MTLSPTLPTSDRSPVPGFPADEIKRNLPRCAAKCCRGLAVALLCAAAVQAEASSRLLLEWTDNADNERGFRIERSIDGASFSQVANLPANTTTWEDAGLEPGRRYWYRIAAYNTGGDADDRPVIDGIAPPLPPGANSPPMISGLTNQTIVLGAAIPPYDFVVSDAQTPAGHLTLLANASDTGLVPLSSIQFGGEGANRTITVSPAPARSGWTTIWVKVSDGVLSSVSSFVLVVTEPKPANPSGLALR